MGSRKLYFQIVCAGLLVLSSGCTRPITAPLLQQPTSLPDTEVLTPSAESGVTSAQPASVPQNNEAGGIEPVPGTFVTEYGRYGLFFAIEPADRDQLAAYLISCDQYGWSLPGLSGLLGSEVAIKNGKFLIDNNDVHVEGEFVNPVTIQGTIKAKSSEATRCGLPENAEWTAQCGAPHPLETLWIGGKAVYTERGPLSITGSK